ncbi:hypothetical protein K1X76_05610 [bacterium]|nr:hypothetical protein [bacterium]
MKKTGIKQKTKAIKQAVAEALEMRKKKTPKADFSDLLGIGLRVPPKGIPTIADEDELWGE